MKAGPSALVKVSQPFHLETWWKGSWSAFRDNSTKRCDSFNTAALSRCLTKVRDCRWMLKEDICLFFPAHLYKSTVLHSIDQQSSNFVKNPHHRSQTLTNIWQTSVMIEPKLFIFCDLISDIFLRCGLHMMELLCDKDRGSDRDGKPWLTTNPSTPTEAVLYCRPLLAARLNPIFITELKMGVIKGRAEAVSPGGERPARGRWALYQESGRFDHCGNPPPIPGFYTYV